MIQESWLKPHQQFKMNGYQVVRNDRNDGRTGRGRDGISLKQLDFAGNLEHQKNELSSNPAITIINIYQGEKTLLKDDLQALSLASFSPVYMGGGGGRF